MKKQVFFMSSLISALVFLMTALPVFAIVPPADKDIPELRKSPDLQKKIDIANRLLEPLLNPETIGADWFTRRFIQDVIKNFEVKADEPGYSSITDANNDKVIDERDFIERAFQAVTPTRQACLSPRKGEAKCIVLLIKFPDVAPKPEHNSAYWQEMFFGNSLYTTRSYFADASKGALNLGGDVLVNPDEQDGYWVAPNNKFFYNWSNGWDLLTNILSQANNIYDFSNYDADGNGEADGVFFIYAGDVTGWGDFYWGWATYGNWIIDGIRVGPIQFVGEDLMTYRVAAHEYVHMMGLPDLYDYTFASAGVGCWSLMGKGEGCLDAWCRKRLGWENPITLGMDIYNAPFTPRSEGGGAYRLWDLGKVGLQYFLVEKITPTIYDYQQPGSGIIIWHVDESVSNNNNWKHKLVDVEEADGLDQLDNASSWGDAGDLYYPGNNTTFNQTSYPNSNANNGTPTAVQVVNIQSASADLIIGIPGNLDVDEIEPNNVWNDSGVIPIPAPNAKPDGKVDVYYDVSDYWRFAVAKPSIVDVTLNSHNNDVDLALIIRGLGGTSIIETADTTWADERVRAYVFVPGNHFVEVKAKRQATYYDLTLNIQYLPDPGFIEIQSYPLLPSKIYDNSMSIPALRIDILNNTGANKLNSLTVYTQGTYPSAIKSISLWKDGGDELFGPGLDTRITGPINVGNSNRVVLSDLNLSLTNYTVIFVVIDTADVSGGEQAGIMIQSYKDFKTTTGSIVYRNFPCDSGLAQIVNARMPLCYVAAGDFIMGSNPATDPYYNPACDLNQETPPHNNRTGNFYISRYEVTNAQFAQFMADGGYTTQSYWTSGGWNWKNENNITQPNGWNNPEFYIGDAYPDYPVGGVSWHECYAFCRYSNGRLPSEREWEKAGRGTDGRIYTYGNTYDPMYYAAWNVYPVGTFPQSDSLYGLSDMMGNIFEWVADSWEWDVYARYASGSFDSPGAHNYRMQRGYRFLIVGDCDTDYASRLSYRDTWPRDYRWTVLGFRVAYDPPS